MLSFFDDERNRCDMMMLEVKDMAAILEGLETVLYNIVEISTFLCEIFGVFVLVYTVLNSFYLWLRKNKAVRLDLAEGIAIALTFKMGGEVLRTVVVRTWSELGILGAIIVLRGLLTFLIQWEIKNEKQELEHLNTDQSAEDV